MQTIGQFGVPPPEVPSPYTSVNKNIINHAGNNVSHSSNTVPSNRAPPTTATSSTTPAAIQAQLGHLPFNTDQQTQQHFLACPNIPSSGHDQPSSATSGDRILGGTAGFHSLPAPAAELHEEDNSTGSAVQIRLHQEHDATAHSANLAPATQAVKQEQRPQVSLGLADQSINEAVLRPSSPNATLKSNIIRDNGIVQISGGAESMAMAEMDQGDDGAGTGNRWPRQETLALLKIRADMDAVFRDASVKRPLWDEVSRKLGELGYERSAKKCKEKFENVNKYYKRTKEGKAGRQDGKNYRFFSQLEALAANSNPNPILTTAFISNNNMNMSNSTPPPLAIPNSVSSYMDTITRFSAEPSDLPVVSLALPTRTEPSFLTTPAPSLVPNHDLTYRAPLATNLNLSFDSSSDEEDDGDEDEDDDIDDEYDDPTPQSNATTQPEEGTKVQHRKRKRKTAAKMMAFFEGLLNKVIEKQEQMQQKFLQALEKRESDRMIREEAWRRQEMARLNKENELRVQERASAATRDAALIAFLQKVTGQNVDFTGGNVYSVPIAAKPVQTAPPLHQGVGTIQLYEEPDPSDPGSKRWLREEVLALIELHNSLHSKFTEAGPKAPLWEEIAQGMTKLGFLNRSAKRCKEKWENINKYFKRAKESNKKRPENAKTCPYFRELEAIHNKGGMGSTQAMTLSSSLQQLPQLSYKPMTEHLHHDVNSVEFKPSTSSCAEDHNGSAGRNVVSMPAESLGHGAALASILNATKGTTNSDTNFSNGGLQNKARTDEVSTDSLHGAGASPLNVLSLEGISPTDRSNGGGNLKTSELGLNVEHQATPSLFDLHQQKPNNQGAGVESTQSKESGPSLTSLPSSSSFMSNMLSKLNSSAPSAGIQGQ